MKHGWDVKKLGDVCKLTNGYAFQSKEYCAEGHFVIRIGNVQDGHIELTNPRYIALREEKQKKFTLSEGDILVSLTGNVGRVGEVKVEHLPAVLNQRVAKISIVGKDFLRDFLLHFLKSPHFVAELTKAGRGAAQQNISTTDIESLIIPLPPLPEQQRIVSILDEVFAAIDRAKANTERNLKNAKELFESYLQEVFKKKSEDWSELTVGDIGRPRMCKRVLKNETTRIGDIPFFKIGTFGNVPDAFITFQLFNNFIENYSFPKKGDVLVSAAGTIGRCVQYDGEPAYFQDSNIVWIENDETQVLNDFLFEFYGACDWGASKGATISRLYNDDLKRIQIAFPKSIEEQRNVVRQLNDLKAETQKLEAVYQKKLLDLDELKKSILQKAFAGELTTA